MRTLGPGSVSSLLKTALDVAYVLLWLVGVVTGLLAVFLFVLAPFAQSLGVGGNSIVIDGKDYSDLTRLSLVAGGAILAVCLYCIALILIVGRLRRIFATLIAGDPFQPDNVRRLRIIGFTLMGMVLLGYVVPPIMAAVARDLTERADFSVGFNPTTWFAVLVVFVLAEVFREGARLRHEAELTI